MRPQGKRQRVIGVHGGDSGLSLGGGCRGCYNVGFHVEVWDGEVAAKSEVCIGSYGSSTQLGKQVQPVDIDSERACARLTKVIGGGDGT